MGNLIADVMVVWIMSSFTYDILDTHLQVDLRSENERRHDRPNGEALLRDTSFMTYFRKNGTLSARVSFQARSSLSLQ